MGASKAERGVLKLVHPGGYVEIHRKPTPASEVMRKNPRHSVARPDVFKFPWIVVRPESVLFPGKVYYIVPNRTIYSLLKARGEQNQSPKYRNHHHRRRADKQTSPRESCAPTTPKHPNRGPLRPEKKTPSTLWDGVSSEEDDSDENGKIYREFKCEKKVESTVKIKPLQTKACHCDRSSTAASSAAPAKSYTRNREIESREGQVSGLKSCLRKPGSVRKPRNFGVSFAFPIAVSRGEPPTPKAVF